jgi:hypothetical protein
MPLRGDAKFAKKKPNQTFALFACFAFFAILPEKIDAW